MRWWWCWWGILGRLVHALGRLAAQSSITTHNISAFSDILPPSGLASRFFCAHVAYHAHTSIWPLCTTMSMTPGNAPAPCALLSTHALPCTYLRSWEWLGAVLERLGGVRVGCVLPSSAVTARKWIFSTEKTIFRFFENTTGKISKLLNFPRSFVKIR